MTRFKKGDYIYTDSSEFDVCYDFTDDNTRYLIGEVLGMCDDKIGNTRYRVKWLNSTVKSSEITKERIADTNTYFKKISYAKMLALLM